MEATRMPVKWDVLGLGAVTVDDLIYVDQYPEPDGRQQIQKRIRQGGGLAGTSLVAVARLGGKAAFCGVLGNDELSAFTLHELETEGVDCHPCVFQEGARPIYSIIIVDQSAGSRAILSSRNGWVEPPNEVLTESLVTNCRVLFVDHTVLRSALHLIPLARRLGIPVVADIEKDQEPQLPLLLNQIDHLIIGIELARRLTQEDDPNRAVQSLASSRRACSVVTDGGQGCWYCERDGQARFFPAFPVQVVDTTGCGDVFHGAYELCIARGVCIPRAIQIASATAALKATQPGGRAGIPSFPTVMQFLAEHGYPGSDILI